jgi:hypothetical protein
MAQKAQYISVASLSAGGLPRSIPGSPPNPNAVPSTQLWVVGSSCELMRWPLTATGNDAPAINLQGTATTLTGPEGSDDSFTYAVDFDSAGNQYALNFALLADAGFLYSIPIFAPNATGDVAPILNIQGSATQLNASFGPVEVFVGGICLDDSSNIFAGARTTILKFPAGSDGNATGTVFLSDVGLDQISSLYFDSARQWIWVSTFNPDVRAYDLSGTLQRQLVYSGFSGPFQVFIGPDGSIFVSDAPRSTGPCVFVFAPTANNNDAPTRTIILPNSELHIPESVSVAVTEDGTIFSSWIDDDQNYHVGSFAADADGTPSPLTDITNPLLTTMIDDASTYPTQLNVR